MKLYEQHSTEDVPVNVNDFKETLDFYHFPYKFPRNTRVKMDAKKGCGNEDLITYTKQLNPLQPLGVSVT